MINNSMRDLPSFTDMGFDNDFSINVEPRENRVLAPNRLSEGIQMILNDRIIDEYVAHYFYRNAANWCQNVNFKEAASYFIQESNTELEHAKKIQEYLTQWNCAPILMPVKSDLEFNSLIDIINQAYLMEYNLLETYSSNQKDLLSMHIPTFNFIQEYVNIQNEAVGEYSDLLNALELINVENKLDVLIFEKTYFKNQL
jgi:ferritin